jgi:signal transduction histidine kinase
MIEEVDAPREVSPQLADAIQRACGLLAASAGTEERQLTQTLIETLQATARGERTQASRALQQVREELLQVREELLQHEQFLAVAAHELRNPITPVMLGLETLIAAATADALPRPELLRRLQKMQRHVQRLRTELEHLLDFARLRHGRIELELEDVDLAEVADDALRELRPVLDASGCELRASLQAQLGRWDRMRLNQVIWNLISNAAKYAAGAPIEVIVSGDEHHAQLIVADHGPGIPEHEHERVFRQFERAGAEHQHTGFGIGLWLVRRIVDAMGGTIGLTSLPGAGATFTVTLPRSRDGGP